MEQVMVLGGTHPKMTKCVAKRRSKQGYSRQEWMSHIKTVLLKSLPDLGSGEKFPLAKTRSARRKEAITWRAGGVCENQWVWLWGAPGFIRTVMQLDVHFKETQPKVG